MCLRFSLGCEDGYYGDLCNKTCENCKNMNCRQTSGRCVEGCKSGWKGLACDKGNSFFMSSFF